MGDFGVLLRQNRYFGAEDWLDRTKLTHNIINIYLGLDGLNSTHSTLFAKT